MQRTILIALAVLTGTARSAVFYVHPDSTQNCIQTCLDACSNNDTVLVGPGIYHENIVWPDCQGIKLLSEFGRDTTIVDGSDTARVIVMAVELDTTTVIRGFTIRNGYVAVGYGAGVLCHNSASPIIESNLFTENDNTDPAYPRGGGGGLGCRNADPQVRFNEFSGNHAAWGGAIWLGNSNALVYGNDITSNHTDTAGGGICCYQTSGGVIDSNRIVGNWTGIAGGGIWCNFASSTISRNTIANDTASMNGGGVFLSRPSAPLLVHNTIVSNYGGYYGGGGVHCCYDCDALLQDNRISGNSAIRGGGIYTYQAWPRVENCVVDSNSSDGVYCYNNAGIEIHWSSIVGNVGFAVRSENLLAMSDVVFNWWGDATGPYHYEKNPGGMGDTVTDNAEFQPWLGSEVIHSVHPDSFFNTIQSGLDACDENEAVCVAPGTYYEHLVWPDTTGIRLGSHYLDPDSTAIDGGDSGRVIQMGASADSSTAVYGFTIQHGYVDEGHGAGILCERGATPLIQRNYFFGNVNDDPLRYGGGIGCFYAHPLVRNNVFERNRAKWGGGLGTHNGSPEVSDNAFTANVADSMGGGICAYWANTPRPLFQRNRFEYDSADVGGAIYCCVSNPRIVENWIGHNHAEACGGMFFTGISPAELIGDTIVGNIADVAGGGIGCSYSDLIIRHCVISDNQAPDGGGIVCWEAGEPDIDSSVISGNSVCGVKSYCRVRHPTINYCDIFDNVGYGVFNADTEYIDAEDNWWGDSTGPHHPLLNPGGQGDTVSDYVDFDPWIGSGISEQTLKHELFLREPATVLRGVLRWSHREAGVLLDISGRQVMALQPGLNDIRHVAPGVYFVRRLETDDGRPREAVRKVIVQK
jgi:parallel beta-helix repeat protein